MAQLGKTR